MTPYLAGIIYGSVLGAAIAAVAMLLWAAYRRQPDRSTRWTAAKIVHLESGDHILQYFELECEFCGQVCSGGAPLPNRSLHPDWVSPRNPAEVRS